MLKEKRMAEQKCRECGHGNPAAALYCEQCGKSLHAAERDPLVGQTVAGRYCIVERIGQGNAGVLYRAEHNTLRRLPAEPRCTDGTLPSPTALAAFWDGACIVAAHQHERAQGRPGYVDATGRLNPDFPDAASRRRWFRDQGEALMGAPEVSA